MTNHQLIALLFPLATVAATGLTGLGIVTWLKRRPVHRPQATDVVEAEFTVGDWPERSMAHAAKAAHDLEQMITKISRDLAKHT
ncbi:hypothetical protein JQ625_32975 [Bradyrhizobium diazoefficiens]|nr:hypothetical protein [Bradyrhizobium diazoefficiens]MBR0779659.1 hypothetical protein [Bradyrhizobium diazoefficiens]